MADPGDCSLASVISISLKKKKRNIFSASKKLDCFFLLLLRKMPWKKKSEVNWKLRSRTPITVLFFPRPGWACNERSSGGLSGSQFVFVLFMWAGQQLRRATRKNHQTFNRWKNTNKHITGWYVIRSDVITQLFLLLSTSSGDLAAVITKKIKKHKIQMLHFLSQLCLLFFSPSQSCCVTGK